MYVLCSIVVIGLYHCMLTFFDTVIFVILGEASADILGLCPPLDEADLWEGEMLQFSPPLMVRKFRARVRGVLAI